MRNRVWNVSMFMGIMLTVATLGVTAYFVIIGKAEAQLFFNFAGPIVGAWAGGALALLKSGSDPGN